MNNENFINTFQQIKDDELKNDSPTRIFINKVKYILSILKFYFQMDLYINIDNGVIVQKFPAADKYDKEVIVFCPRNGYPFKQKYVHISLHQFRAEYESLEHYLFKNII